jgi:enoyl-CoA hydratase/carnithine racemase
MINLAQIETHDMSEALVTTTQEERLLWLTLNRPDKRNPLSSDMIAALSAALQAGYEDKTTRVIIINSTGVAFSAGHDLAETQQRLGESLDEWQQRLRTLLSACADMMTGIVHAPKPVIASVQGIASAAGCQLVSACDLALASETATFCTPGVNIGTFCTTPLVGIGRNLSRKHALEMALTGDQFTAATAERFGLINRVEPADNLTQATRQLGLSIASRSAESIARGKSAFYRQVEMPLDDAFALANEVMLDNLTAAGDAKEGAAAFFEKRPPEWQG